MLNWGKNKRIPQSRKNVMSEKPHCRFWELMFRKNENDLLMNNQAKQGSKRQAFYFTSHPNSEEYSWWISTRVTLIYHMYLR